MFNFETGIETCSKCGITAFKPADTPESLWCPYCGEPSKYTLFSASSLFLIKCKKMVAEGLKVPEAMHAGYIQLTNAGGE